MPDQFHHEWHQEHTQHGYYNPMPLLAGQWDEHDPQNRAQNPLGGMQDVDLRMFQHDSAAYASMGSYADPVGSFVSEGVGYQGDNWPPDEDMATPATVGFAPEAQEESHTHLRLPQQYGAGSLSSQSPQPSHARPSRDDRHLNPQDVKRPTVARCSTAPEPRQRVLATSRIEPSALKRGNISEDGDDDEYIPGGFDDTKNRGRKRQRIPHTAVERRYRENLNAHLDKLRQAIPSLSAKSRAGEGVAVEGVKPSKCEILNGAIEHISALDRENQGLRDEVHMLKAKAEEIERRYRRGK